MQRYSRASGLVAGLALIALSGIGCAPNSAAGTIANPNHNGNQVASKYAYVDPLDIVPASLKSQALAYYDANLATIANQNYLSIVDFSLFAGDPRFFIIDMTTGSVLALHVAHGMGSDPNDTGYATTFSNTPNSDQSSLGYYMTAETYTGDNGYSLRLDGLSSTNSNVRVRDIVVHGAAYVYDTDTQAGRSLGCFAVPADDRDNVINMIQGGSIIFAALEK